MALTKVTYGLLSADTSAIDLNIDANTLYVDSSANKVGIQTNSPSLALEVNDTSNVDGEQISIKGHANYGGTVVFRRGDSFNWRVGVGGGSSTNSTIPSSYFGFEQGNTASMVIAHTTGYVGIGTTNPSYKLEVNSGTSDWPARFISSDDKAGIIIADNDTVNYLVSRNSYLSMGGSSDLSATNLNVNKTTGFVGIGTTSPVYNFQVVGSGDTIASVVAGNSSVAGFNMGSSGTPADGGIRYDNSADKLIFRAGNATKAELSSAGALTLNSAYTFPTADGSANQVLQTDGSGALSFATISTSDSTKLPLAGGALTGNLSTNSRIAIGQSTFTGGNTLVDIHGSGSGVGANIAFANDHNTDKFYVGVAGDTTGDVLVYNAEDSDMIFATNNSERMRIMNDGKVGIGITNPSQILNLKANTPFIQFSQDGSDSYAGINFGDDDDANDGQILYDHDSRYMRFQVANAERIRIDSSGNVGIGSSTINAKLNVHGTIRAENERFLAGRENAAAPAYAFHDDADTGMFNVASNILAFSTSGTERMRITSDGKVFIGSSNSGAYGGLGDLVFQQSANDLGIGIINSGEDNTLKLINNGTVAKIEHNGAVPIQIKNANSVLAEFDTYAIPKMNFNFAHAAATYASGSTTNDELGNGQGVLMLKQQITVRDGSRILIWYDSGQILNSNQGGSGSANSNPQIAIYVTTNSSAPPSRGKSHMINMQDTDHFMYPMGDVGAARVKMNGIGATDTISTGGTYYIYMYGGTYNSGSYTFNYQHSSSNDRGASIIWAEVIA